MASLQDAVLRNAEAAGQQEQEGERLRDGHREGGAAWLRTELEAKNRADLRRLCALLGLPSWPRWSPPCLRSGQRSESLPDAECHLDVHMVTACLIPRILLAEARQV